MQFPSSYVAIAVQELLTPASLSWTIPWCSDPLSVFAHRRVNNILLVLVFLSGVLRSAFVWSVMPLNSINISRSL